MMRPLVMDFQSDAKALSIKDQYMFGKALLVSPVTQPGASARMVYLPAGSAWFDFWTGVRHVGGRPIVAKADLATVPVFARAGSVLPLGPDRQYADQKSAEPIELRVYPGADGQFELYDDQGDGYGYEQGQHTTTLLSWNDRQRVLTIGARQGRYAGMAEQQRFKLVCGAATSKGSQMIVYTGAARTVPLPSCR